MLPHWKLWHLTPLLVASQTTSIFLSWAKKVSLPPPPPPPPTDRLIGRVWLGWSLQYIIDLGPVPVVGPIHPSSMMMRTLDIHIHVHCIVYHYRINEVSWTKLTLGHLQTELSSPPPSHCLFQKLTDIISHVRLTLALYNISPAYKLVVVGTY